MTKDFANLLPFHFRVERRHIKAGKDGSCTECPVALALEEALKPLMGDVKILVGPDDISIDTDEFSREVCTSAGMKRFVNRFDKNGRARPQGFILTRLVKFF